MILVITSWAIYTQLFLWAGIMELGTEISTDAKLHFIKNFSGKLPFCSKIQTVCKNSVYFTKQAVCLKSLKWVGNIQYLDIFFSLLFSLLKSQMLSPPPSPLPSVQSIFLPIFSYSHTRSSRRTFLSHWGQKNVMTRLIPFCMTTKSHHIKFS